MQLSFQQRSQEGNLELPHLQLYLIVTAPIDITTMKMLYLFIALVTTLGSTLALPPTQSKDVDTILKGNLAEFKDEQLHSLEQRSVSPSKSLV